jgi:hypothetical protein
MINVGIISFYYYPTILQDNTLYSLICFVG